MKILRLGERILTIHDAPFEWDAFEWEYYYDFETKILDKSGEDTINIEGEKSKI